MLTVPSRNCLRPWLRYRSGQRPVSEDIAGCTPGSHIAFPDAGKGPERFIQTQLYKDTVVELAGFGPLLTAGGWNGLAPVTVFHPLFPGQSPQANQTKHLQ